MGMVFGEATGVYKFVSIPNEAERKSNMRIRNEF